MVREGEREEGIESIFAAELERENVGEAVDSKCETQEISKLYKRSFSWKV